MAAESPTELVQRLADAKAELVAARAVGPAIVIAADTEVVLDRANMARPDASTEPWLTILPAATHLGLIARSGWVPTSWRDDATFGTGAPSTTAGAKYVVQ